MKPRLASRCRDKDILGRSIGPGRWHGPQPLALVVIHHPVLPPVQFARNQCEHLTNQGVERMGNHKGAVCLVGRTTDS